uniref:glutaminase n=1 Tax=Electrophorus electricus TaxID=8005 RepID=A0A4W4EN05_ELEEL
MHCLKHLRLSNARICLTRQAGNLLRPGSNGERLFRRQLRTSASSPTQHPHFEQVVPDQGTVYRKGVGSGQEDLLFYTITQGEEKISVSHFVNALQSTGLVASDPRLQDCMQQLDQAVQESAGTAVMDQELFRKCAANNIILLTEAFQKKFIIPDFMTFIANINQLYYSAQNQQGGQVANYIPQLAKFSPDLWGVSLCTVDGQRHSVGDTRVPFCLQSCIKPLEYALAIHESGTEKVHQYVGKEPSGVKFNKLNLNEDDKPHNPMVNAGAIVISSLIKPEVKKAEKFDYVSTTQLMAGGEYVGFSNATFQSEKETGDRNFAIGYYLKEKKCFPQGADMIAALDFYFQVGLPAKSGVSGAVLLVVPNIMGLMCWSPPVDRVGNSVRGIHFCQELVSLFNFHNYDNLRHFAKKLDPRRQAGHERNKAVIELMFAAYSGDVSALRRFALSAVDMELRDYDSRSALHVAAAEGHLEAVKFLTGTCRVNPHVKDRWGNTPLDDALQFSQDSVVEVLKQYQCIYSHTLLPEVISPQAPNGSTLDAEDLRSMELLEGFV